MKFNEKLPQNRHPGSFQMEPILIKKSSKTDLKIDFAKKK